MMNVTVPSLAKVAAAEYFSSLADVGSVSARTFEGEGLWVWLAWLLRVRLLWVGLGLRFILVFLA